MMSMKVIAIASTLLFAMTSASSLRAQSQDKGDDDKEKDGCAGQARFDVIMCKSHMCTDCILAWCTETCRPGNSSSQDADAKIGLRQGRVSAPVILLAKDRLAIKETTGVSEHKTLMPSIIIDVSFETCEAFH